MDNTEIKKANLKALPKFLLIMVIALVVGCLTGYISGHYGLNTLADDIKSAGKLFGVHIAPWLMMLTAVLVPVTCIPLYRSAKKLLASWDGENEELSDTIDKKLSIIIWITNTALILGYFLIAASYSGGFSSFETQELAVLFFTGIVAFFAILLESVILQQKCVDTAKKTNPEKTVSFYDPKFQKKWMDSCDEAEKLVIGKCAFKAYAATNTVCTVLAIVLSISALVFETGFLPTLAVCLIWIVNMSVYLKEALRYSKAGIKIS